MGGLLFHLHREFIGKNGGNFRPAKVPRDLFLQNLKLIAEQRKITKIFAPVCQLTTNVARLGEKDQATTSRFFVRTNSGTDGGFVRKADIALAMFNADCPAIILCDRYLGQLTMLHAGFRCLVPENSRTPDIAWKAFFKFPINRYTTQAFIGFGAGPCCYGAEHLNEINSKSLEPFIGLATAGPRKGQRSINLHQLAKAKLIANGMPRYAIEIDSTCSACHGRNSEQGNYYSNVYEGPTTGRNLVLAWMTFQNGCLTQS